MTSKSEKEVVYLPGGNGGEARGGSRFAQSRPPPETPPGNRRRRSAKKHSDDWPHRRGKNGNRATPGTPRGLPVRKGGSFEVHGSRLRRPRRGIDGARPSRDFH